MQKHPENLLLFSILFVLLIFCILVAKFILTIPLHANIDLSKNIIKDESISKSSNV